MAPKIKNLTKKPTRKRRCGVCGKLKEMEKFQRFCSPTCKGTAADLDRFGSEHSIKIGKK